MELTKNERVALELLVDDALDGQDSRYAIPFEEMSPPQLKQGESESAPPRRLTSEQRRGIAVFWVPAEKLTPGQREYLAGLLEKVAALCGEKAKRLRQ
jgi:hypothetical protein